MRKSTRWIVTSLALAGSALQAQNIAGTWQGTLKAGPQELRTVLKISLEDDKYRGTLYSIDQNPTPIPTSSFTKDGPVVKYAISVINVSYEGRLSADGNTITGTWTQFGNPSAVNLVRATPETAWTRPVVDQTGLGDKRWDFTLNYTPDSALAAQAAGGAGTNGQPAVPGDPDAPPDLFTAFQQQLGLKLESTKAPVDVIVVDRAEKPTEN